MIEKSTTGYSFQLQQLGTPITWSTKMKTIAAISNKEAEYQAMAAAVREALYLRSFLNEIVVVNVIPAIIEEDNQSFINMDIDLKYHFLQNRLEDETVELQL